MKNKPLFWILSCLLALTALRCGDSELTPQTREEEAGKISDSLTIGVAWPFSVKQDLFKQGIELGIEEINAAGGVLGREVVAEYADDQGMITEGKLVAQAFAENPSMVAVVGHYNSFIAVPAAVIYEYYGMLLLSPGATATGLTTQGYNRIFRTIPNDEQIGGQLADFANNKGYGRIVILHEKSDYGTGLANAFEFRSEELDMFVAMRLSYDSNLQDYRRVLEELRLIDFDAIFIAGYGADAGLIIKQLREMGVDVPFMGGDGLDTKQLWALDPDAVEGTTVLTVFNPDEPRAVVQEFNTRFQRRFGTLPDAWAAQGYDTVRLLAYAMNGAESLNPNRIADQLRSIEGWEGVTGSHTFSDRGDVVGKNMVKQVVEGQRFRYVED